MNTSTAIGITNNNSAVGSESDPFTIRHFVHHRGTTECEVSFQLKGAKMAIARDFFAMLYGRKMREQAVMQFSSCYIVPRGCGWYRVYGWNKKVDGALDAIKHITNALKVKAGLLISRINKPVLPTIKLESRRIICQRQVAGSIWSVFVNRKTQATIGLFNLCNGHTEEPRKLTRFSRQLTSTVSAPTVAPRKPEVKLASANRLQSLVNRLHNRFHYA